MSEYARMRLEQAQRRIAELGGRAAKDGQLASILSALGDELSGIVVHCDYQSDVARMRRGLESYGRTIIPVATEEPDDLVVVDTYSHEDQQLAAMNAQTYRMPAAERAEWFRTHPVRREDVL
jgi:hypothetical protein